MYYLLTFNETRSIDGKPWKRGYLAETLSDAINAVVEDIEANDGYCTLSRVTESYEHGDCRGDALRLEEYARKAIAEDAAERRSDGGLKAWHEGRLGVE